LQARAEVEHGAHAPRRVRSAHALGKLGIREQRDLLVAERAERDVGEPRLIRLVGRECADESDREPPPVASGRTGLDEAAPSEEIVVSARPTESQPERSVFGPAGESDSVIVNTQVVPVAEGIVGTHDTEPQVLPAREEAPVRQIVLVGPGKIRLAPGEHPVDAGVREAADRCLPRGGARKVVAELVIIERNRLFGVRGYRHERCGDDRRHKHNETPAPCQHSRRVGDFMNMPPSLTASCRERHDTRGLSFDNRRRHLTPPKNRLRFYLTRPFLKRTTHGHLYA